MNLVQPIILMTPTSHEDAVEACAIASFAVYEATKENPVWDEWLSGSFTKSVRRVEHNKFWRLADELEPFLIPVVGEDHAFALPPARYEHFHPAVRRLQVSGTNAPHTRPPSVPTNTPAILVDNSLGMSTGKTAAQVAHAYWIGSLNGTFDSFPNVHYVDHSTFNRLAHYGIPVTDAGLTEFDEPTRTCVVVGDSWR